MTVRAGVLPMLSSLATIACSFQRCGPQTANHSSQREGSIDVLRC